MASRTTEPGIKRDLYLGLPGDAEPRPKDDADQHEPTRINDAEED